MFRGSPAIKTVGKIALLVSIFAIVSGFTQHNMAAFWRRIVGTTSNLDTTFSGDGKDIYDIGTGYEGLQALAIQSDNKIVVAGYTDNAGATNDDILVMRYNTNGTLDTTFGTSGVKVIDVATSNSIANAVALKSDGKIWVFGNNNESNQDFVLIRLNADGSLDTTFDTDGIKTINSSGTRDDYGESLAVQADGKLILAGHCGTNRACLMRVNEDGTFDTGFNTTGQHLFDIASDGGFEEVWNVKIQSDGKIVAGGYYDNAGTDNGYVARFNTDGTFDTSFGTSGIALIAPISGSINEIREVQIQPDGKIVGCGLIDGPTNIDTLCVRFNSDGTLDTSFSSDGVASIEGSVASADYANGVVLQGNGKIVTGGRTDASGGDSMLCRFNTDGSADTTFSASGCKSQGLSSAEWIHGIEIQRDGKFVTVGRYYTTSNQPGIARWWP